MKFVLALASLLGLFFGCQSVPPAEVAGAALYFPPEFKYIAEARYSFSPAERQRALQEYRAHGADTLFEILIDAEGQVRKARLLRTRVRKIYHEQMEEHARRLVFSKDPSKHLLRAFYFPTKYTLESQFEWL